MKRFFTVIYLLFLCLSCSVDIDLTEHGEWDHEASFRRYVIEVPNIYGIEGCSAEYEFRDIQRLNRTYGRYDNVYVSDTLILIDIGSVDTGTYIGYIKLFDIIPYKGVDTLMIDTMIYDFPAGKPTISIVG